MICFLSLFSLAACQITIPLDEITIDGPALPLNFYTNNQEILQEVLEPTHLELINYENVKGT